MKKVLLTNDVKALTAGKSSFLDRADIMVFTAATNAEVLKVHRDEGVSLIVTHLDTPGIKSEVLYETIRNSEALRDVSTILVCNDTLTQRERSKACRTNAVFTMPVDVTLLHIKMQELLSIAPRISYRVALAVAIQGKFKDRPLPFLTENISVSGMLIRTEEPLSKGDGIFFSFFLPDGKHVSGYGEIKRVVQTVGMNDFHLYGIRFTNIAPDLQAAIEAVVNA
jgi:hypothetical protein